MAKIIIPVHGSSRDLDPHYLLSVNIATEEFLSADKDLRLNPLIQDLIRFMREWFGDGPYHSVLS